MLLVCPRKIYSMKLIGFFMKLRTHAIKARDVLRHIVTEIPKDREQKVKVLGEADKQYIEDEWPALSVGWIPLPTLRKELGLEESVEMMCVTTVYLC